MDTPINLRYVIFLAATAALGGLLFGFDIGIITGAGEFAIDDSNAAPVRAVRRPPELTKR